MTQTLEQVNAIRLRNDNWVSDNRIPKWVDLEEVTLDQFYTRPEVAADCYQDLMSFLAAEGVDARSFTFLEPSAGLGAFFEQMPSGRRIGVDLIPHSPSVVRGDFLSWTPEGIDMPIVAVGNPPFGYRGWLALEFLNHLAGFTEYVGFILPMAFQSVGKGSPRLRVKGLHLVKSVVLPQGSFTDAIGRVVKVNALWQIWKKGDVETEPEPSCDSWVELFTVDQRAERLCGQDRMAEADFFLQRTFYKDPPTLVRSFDEVKYVCGYGIIIKKDQAEVIRALQEADWSKYSNLAAHNCHHISMYHIRKVLTDGGFIDGRKQPSFGSSSATHR